MHSLLFLWTRLLAGVALAALLQPAHAQLSLKTLKVNVVGGTETRYQIDTGGGLVFTIRASGPNGSANTFVDGDITNMVYRGVDYQSKAAGSHVVSGANNLYAGVSAVSVSAGMFSSVGVFKDVSTAANGVLNGGEYVRVTVTAYSANGKPFVHYYIARRGIPYIYMATYFEEEPDVQPLVRFVARIPRSLLPYGPGDELNTAGGSRGGRWSQDVSQTDLTIEGKDVYSFSSGPFKGETRSKHYSNQRRKDWLFIGGRNGLTAQSSNVGVWFATGNTEGSSSGPFYRSLVQSIGYKATGDNNEITYNINYGMAQTDPYRIGVLNTYTLIFNSGSVPSQPPVLSWFDLLGLKGWVGPAQRGGLAANGVRGMLAGYQYTVGLTNSSAQYWAPVDVASTRFGRSGMIPGEYVLTIYKNELPVYTHPAKVSVIAGSTLTLNSLTINNDPESTGALWRIGRWDGTPVELLNGTLLTAMHPSDVRLAPWIQAEPFITSAGARSDKFPAYQWRDVNGKLRIEFNLPADPATDLTMRIGTTTEFKSAVPQITVNESWLSAAPDIRPVMGSRNLTVGTYRGVNRMYAIAIPKGTLRAGKNVVDLSVLSDLSGTGFQSPGLSYDAIDLVVKDGQKNLQSEPRLFFVR